MNIIRFISSSKIKKIKSDLPGLLKNMSAFCNEIIGKGMMGSVMIQNVGKTMKIRIKDVIIEIPVVIKKAYNIGSFEMNIIDNKIYISCYKDITTEAILLYYVSQLWYKKKSPHLPPTPEGVSFHSAPYGRNNGINF